MVNVVAKKSNNVTTVTKIIAVMAIIMTSGVTDEFVAG